MNFPHTLTEIVGNASALQKLLAFVQSTHKHIHLYGPYGTGKRTVIRILFRDCEEHFCSLMPFRELIEVFDARPQLTVARPIVLYDTHVLPAIERNRLQKAISNFPKRHFVLTIGEFAMDADESVRFDPLSSSEIQEVLGFLCVEQNAWKYFDRLLRAHAPQSINAGIQEMMHDSDRHDSLEVKPTMLHAHTELKSKHWESCIEMLSLLPSSPYHDAPLDVKYQSLAIFYNRQAMVARSQSVLKLHCRTLSCSALEFHEVQRLLLHYLLEEKLFEHFAENVDIRRALSYHQPRVVADRLRRLRKK